MQKIITVVGGSGFIGRHVVQALCREGYQVRVICRDTVSAAYLKTFGQVGQVVLQYGDITKPKTLESFFAGSFAVINLVGILQPSGRQTFKAVQSEGAKIIAELAKNAGAERFIHLSAIGANRIASSRYAQSKKAGEDAVKAAFPDASILRPSLVIGPEDAFFQRFARMAMLAHVLPLIGSGKSRFQPVLVMDVVAATLACLTRSDTKGQTYELGGPDNFTFRELLAMIGHVTHRAIRLVSIPTPIAYVQASLFECLPITAPFTRDQIRLLAHDNVVAPDAKNFASLGITPTAITSMLPEYLSRFVRT